MAQKKLVYGKLSTEYNSKKRSIFVPVDSIINIIIVLEFIFYFTDRWYLKR
jgi:hypothetical protein